MAPFAFAHTHPINLDISFNVCGFLWFKYEWDYIDCFSFNSNLCYVLNLLLPQFCMSFCMPSEKLSTILLGHSMTFESLGCVMNAECLRRIHIKEIWATVFRLMVSDLYAIKSWDSLVWLMSIWWPCTDLRLLLACGIQKLECWQDSSGRNFPQRNKWSNAN